MLKYAIVLTIAFLLATQSHSAWSAFDPPRASWRRRSRRIQRSIARIARLRKIRIATCRGHSPPPRAEARRCRPAASSRGRR